MSIFSANLESKVKSLLREVPNHAGKVSSPESEDSLVSPSPFHTVGHSNIAPI